MKRRTFLQIPIATVVGIGASSRFGAVDASPLVVGTAVRANEPGAETGYRCRYFALGEHGVSACRRFLDPNWLSHYPGQLGLQDQGKLTDAFAGVDGCTGCLLILSARDTDAMQLALPVARALDSRGALFTVAVLLHPPEVPWHQLTGESRVRQLQMETTAAVLQPASTECGMGSPGPREPLFQTLSLFAMEHSLIECDIQDIQRVLGSGGLWLGRSAPFAGIEQGEDPGAVVNRCLADVPVDRPSALIASWRTELQDMTIASYGAIVTACGHWVETGGDLVVTTALALGSGDQTGRLLMLARVD